MGLFIYFKSGKQYEFITQIRLTRSKNGATGTAIFEVNISKLNSINSVIDPIYSVGFKKDNFVRTADVCHFIWSLGKPLKLIAIFIFANLEEKQEFFNYYSYYALSKSLEFFPAQSEEKTPNNK